MSTPRDPGAGDHDRSAPGRKIFQRGKARKKKKRRPFQPDFLGLERRFLPATFMVLNTNDSGAGSLRQAISSSNSTPGSNIIDFNIGSGPLTIIPASALPSITVPVFIDGTTQHGFAGTPIIEIAGSGLAADGLFLAGGSNGSTITGLVISGFGGHGVEIQSSFNVVEGNFLGTDASGENAGPGNQIGVYINCGSGNTIGGLAATPGTGAGNLISGNTVHGVQVTSGGTGNLIAGNLIGLDSTGTTTVPNGSEGVSLFFAGTGNSIGGAVPGAGNVLSGNGFEGIDLSATNGALVAGNLIGTDITGTHKMGNAVHGLSLTDSSNNTIGGTTGAARNVIGANADLGLFMTDATNLFGRPGGPSNDNLVEGNSIGVDSSGTIALGNGNIGVYVLGSAANNTIGGTAAGEGNVIAYNNSDGVFVSGTSATGDTIRGNSIHDNGGLGIDLTGNNLIGAPSVLSAQPGVNTDVEVSVVGAPSATFEIDFYASPAPDAAGRGEGQRFLGTLSVMTGGNGTVVTAGLVRASVRENSSPRQQQTPPVTHPSSRST